MSEQWNASSGPPATYTYDGNGLRVQKVAGGATNTYIFSGSKVIAEYNAWYPGIAPVTTEYVYAGGAMLARVGAVDVRFTNDSCSACGGNPQGGGDRNLFVSSITLGSTVISSSDPSISYTNAPCNANGTLACSGDMVTVAPAGMSATTIKVTAYGSPDFNIYPHMQLLVGGVVVAEWDVTGTSQDYTATLSTTAARYYHQDHLSNRLVTNASGSVAAEMGHFPFGESWYNSTNDKLYFTTYEYDSESGNHYAMARYHVSRLGRLSSPDPIAGSTANPQSLNRYSYSINDPANVTESFWCYDRLQYSASTTEEQDRASRRRWAFGYRQFGRRCERRGSRPSATSRMWIARQSIWRER